MRRTLILIGVLLVQMDLVSSLQSEIAKRQQEEARRMAREAIELYVEDLVADGEKVPESDNTLLGTVEVQVAK